MIRRILTFILLSTALLQVSCGQQAEPPPLNRPVDPGRNVQQKLCRQVKIVPGKPIAQDMRVRLFNCLNWDGELQALEPIITDEELFNALSGMVSSGSSGNFKDVVGNINVDILGDLLPFIGEILRREVIPNMVPLIHRVVMDLSGENLLSSVLPSMTSMLKSEYAPHLAQSSSAALSSGALGTFLRSVSDWSEEGPSDKS